MASRALPVLLPCLDATEPERPPPTALVSDLLEEIFLRVASPADLARASAACVAFRDLIRSPSFLRRYRSAHPPLLLGFVNAAALSGFHPVEVEATHPAAAASRGVAARTVDFSFLRHPLQGFYPHDVRDGRVLVIRHRDMGRRFRRRRRGKYCLDIAVCDPVFQQYLLLPPITDDLLASVGLRNKDMSHSGASFIPSASGGGTEEETSFSVICWMFPKTRFGVFIFSTSSAHWAAVKSISWVDLGLSEEDDDISLVCSGQCVYGCYYWRVYCKDKLLKLDLDTKEFSKYDLPPDHDQRSITIVESGEGEVAMFSALGEGSVEYYTFMQNGADKSHEWHLKSTIPLPVHGLHITGQAEGFVFLAHFIEEQDKIYIEYFSLEVKSCNVERACRISGRKISFPYFGFPPSMSPRRIQGHGQDSLALV